MHIHIECEKPAQFSCLFMFFDCFLIFFFFFPQDSSSVVEWTQTPKDKCSQGADRPSSYEAEWDMVTTVSFKKKPHSNGGT